MRLLRLSANGEPRLTRYLHNDIPPYAILSHTWSENDDDEVSMIDLESGAARDKPGFGKLEFCLEQARKDGLEHCWIDTCCIKKSDSVELSEAINSMFNWYKDAAKCYVYLSDVSARKRTYGSETSDNWEASFRTSKWFSRGWTLQELLAPTSVEFFSREGQYLTNKQSVPRMIQEITSIPLSALQGAPLDHFQPAEVLQWMSNRSTKKTEDKVYSLIGLLGVAMTTNYGEKEKALDRLKEKLSQSYRNQVQGIGQGFFASDTANGDENSIPARMVSGQQADPDVHRKEVLDLLKFDHMDSRHASVKNPSSKTCEWFLEHQIYRNWLSIKNMHEHNGFLWIKGKAGAGKSTLMKFIYTRAKEHIRENEIVISFFFNARGYELEKSTLGMYQSILFQLLNQVPELQCVLDGVRVDSRVTWTVENLVEILSAAIDRLGERHLKCFIDALDECDEQAVRDMVIIFEELSQKALDKRFHFSACFASRPYPTIDIRYGQAITLEHEPEHTEDIKKYISSHLRAGKSKYVEKIKSDIEKKANDVFLWVVLVVKILNEEFLRGRIFAVEKRLREIPPELSELFRDIIGRDSSNMADLILCLQWILYARRPLRREEFYFAMVAGLDLDEESVITAWDPEYVTLQDMELFVLNSSKGLAELTRTKEPVVQFIHESVKDFLVKDYGLAKLWPNQTGDFMSTCHEQLKRCCQKWLSVKLRPEVRGLGKLPPAKSPDAQAIRRHFSERFPFLNYASDNVLFHADEAAKSIPQEEFLKTLDWIRWFYIHNVFERHEIRRYNLRISLLYVLADKGYARLIKAHNNGLEVDHKQDGRYCYPLFAALVNKQWEAFRALLRIDDDLVWTTIVEALKMNANLTFNSKSTPLHWAAEQGNELLFKAILSNSRAECLHAKDLYSRTPLCLAIGKGHEPIICLLLDKQQAGFSLGSIDDALAVAVGVGDLKTTQLLLSADRHSYTTTDQKSGELVHIAAVNGHSSILQMLLDNGAPLEAVDVQGHSALDNAIRQGCTDTVRLLLKAGSYAKVRDRHGRTTLHHASSLGNVEIVQLILDQFANVDCTDENECTALHDAAERGSLSIVRILLQKGANISHGDNRNRTALHKAAKAGHTEVIKLLLDNRAHIEATDDGESTALHTAAEDGHIEVIKLLLDEGAHIEARGFAGFTALHIATLAGHVEVIKLLLDRGAHVDATDITRITALHQAAAAGHVVAAQGLLDGGAKIEYTDTWGRTALHRAIHGRSWDVVSLLLSKNANIEARCSGGYTALYIAAVLGLEDIVKLLISMGADLEAADQKGRTAVQVAHLLGKTDVVKLLLVHGAILGADSKASPLRKEFELPADGLILLVQDLARHIP